MTPWDFIGWAIGGFVWLVLIALVFIFLMALGLVVLAAVDFCANETKAKRAQRKPNKK